MENDGSSSITTEDARSSKRGRIMGKLFGRDRKSGEGNSNNDSDLNAFLHGPSDRLEVAHAAPPVLSKLDTSHASSRYLNAPSADSTSTLPQTPQQHLSVRPRSQSQQVRKRKGLLVRFVETAPEIIGRGGDECDIPVVEITRMKRMRPPPITTRTTPQKASDISKAQSAFPDASRGPEDFSPGPLRRAQTGFSTIGDSPGRSQIVAGSDAPSRLSANSTSSADDRRKSVIEIQQAYMREAEGQAFANAVRKSSSSQPGGDENRGSPFRSSDTTADSPNSDIQPAPVPQPRQITPQESRASPAHPLPPPPYPPPSNASFQARSAAAQQYPESPEHRMRKMQGVDQSPASSIYSQTSVQGQPPPVYRNPSRRTEWEDRGGDADSPSSPQKASLSLHDVVQAVGDDAMKTFVTRTQHLFELYRLHSESVRPLLACKPDELVRAAVWWFLRGRMALEMVIRERPADAEAQRRNENAKQQAFADLAKGYWLSEEIIPEVTNAKHLDVTPEVEDARGALVSGLRKLSGSMKRNGFLPPEEALLPAHLDRSIWIEYPKLSQDIISLLWGSSSSGLSQLQRPTSGISVLEALPLGDTPSLFCFGRVHADAWLMEDGVENTSFYFPCLLSITRPQQQPDIVFVMGSQDGAIQLRISGNKKMGPTWEEVKWRPNTRNLDIKLPRGFVLVVQFSQSDYQLLRSMYDFSSKVQSTLYARKDEQCLFRSTLRSFQYFDNDPQARQFPRESVANCELALFERLLREGAATGPRCYHRGFRIAVVTGPRTKTLSGVNQTYNPNMPIQFGFLRGENQSPALQITFENGKIKGSMVMSFDSEKERIRMHGLLSGIAVRNDEQVCCDVPVSGVWFSERYGDTNLKALSAFSNLPWQKARIVNEDTGERPPCVLAEKLRIVFEFKDGTMTDRVNAAPGELKLRLDVKNPSCMQVFRQPQQDLTLAFTEPKSSRDKIQAFNQALDSLQQSATIRTYMFPSMNDLHAFESALTGFKILYDGVATAFAIARRRMVVPIHKKWEAGSTRIQLVQQDGVMQLLAFFEDFTHGQSMSFPLKGTDVFETFSRSGKAGLKIDDAKFPLPKVFGDANDRAQIAAEAAFVCLDLPELPGEHDDISILFDSEADRQKLIACLPSPVKASRLTMARTKGS